MREIKGHEEERDKAIIGCLNTPFLDLGYAKGVTSWPWGIEMREEQFFPRKVHGCDS